MTVTISGISPEGIILLSPLPKVCSGKIPDAAENALKGTIVDTFLMSHPSLSIITETIHRYLLFGLSNSLDISLKALRSSGFISFSFSMNSLISLPYLVVFLILPLRFVWIFKTLPFSSGKASLSRYLAISLADAESSVITKRIGLRTFSHCLYDSSYL